MKTRFTAILTLSLSLCAGGQTTDWHPSQFAWTQTATGECVLELGDGRGSFLRMRLKGYQAAELATLGRSLWRG